MSINFKIFDHSVSPVRFHIFRRSLTYLKRRSGLPIRQWASGGAISILNPSALLSSLHTSDMKMLPLSDWMRSGHPKWVTHCEMMALATSTASTWPSLSAPTAMRELHLLKASVIWWPRCEYRLVEGAQRGQRQLLPSVQLEWESKVHLV